MSHYDVVTNKPDMCDHENKQAVAATGDNTHSNYNSSEEGTGRHVEIYVVCLDCGAYSGALE